MNRQAHSTSREIIVASAIKEVVSELRMVDVADYIAFIRLEHFANVSDIVDSAAELFFMPGTLKLGHGGEAHVGWSGEPRIVLDLELRPRGATVYFALAMIGRERGGRGQLCGVRERRRDTGREHRLSGNGDRGRAHPQDRTARTLSG